MRDPSTAILKGLAMKSFREQDFSYCITEQSATVTDMFLEADDALFRKILYNKAHVLHSFSLDRPEVVYSLCHRSHNKSLMCKTRDLNERNFLVRVIYTDCY